MKPTYRELEIRVKELERELARYKTGEAKGPELSGAALRKSSQLRSEESGKQTERYEEVTTALKVLIKNRELDQQERESKMFSRINELIKPFFEKLRQSGLNRTQAAYVEVMAFNIDAMMQPMMDRLPITSCKLTQRELQIVAFIRLGKTTREIAEISKLSPRTIECHRNNIRKKAGLRHKKTNLRSYLLLKPE